MPTTASFTSAMMARAASTAAGVRSVISTTGNPPATSARASGTAAEASSMVMTGTDRRQREQCIQPRP